MPFPGARGVDKARGCVGSCHWQHRSGEQVGEMLTLPPFSKCLPALHWGTDQCEGVRLHVQTSV